MRLDYQFHPTAVSYTHLDVYKRQVHRNGVVAVIDVDDVVVGDQVLLQSGDKIPADGILHTGNLKVNNSALNGEAEECEKKAAGERCV